MRQRAAASQPADEEAFLSRQSSFPDTPHLGRPKLPRLFASCSGLGTGVDACLLSAQVFLHVVSAYIHVYVCVGTWGWQCSLGTRVEERVRVF